MMFLVLVGYTTSCSKKKSIESNECDVTFWTDDDDCIQEIEVNLWSYDSNYDSYSYITKYYDNTPDCGASYCANFKNLKSGDYYYWAENDYYEWEGDLKVKSSCHTIRLYVSKAKVKSGADISTGEKLLQAEMDFDMNKILID